MKIVLYYIASTIADRPPPPKKKNRPVSIFDMKNTTTELSTYRSVRFGYIKRLVKNKYYKTLVNLICKSVCTFLSVYLLCEINVINIKCKHFLLNERF